MTHSEDLFVTYTRRGADNDHIFRHRAPIFMARVDPQRLVVIRDTERIIIPETGTRMGNFGIVDVSPGETWVITTEWMQPHRPRSLEEIRHRQPNILRSYQVVAAKSTRSLNLASSVAELVERSDRKVHGFRYMLVLS